MAAGSSRRTPTPRASIWAGRTRRSRSRATILPAWREAGRRSVPEYEAWQARVAALDPDKRRDVRPPARGAPAGGLGARAARLQATAPRRRGTPTTAIKISGDIVELLAEAIPELISGAPDLEGRHAAQAALCRLHRGRTASGRYVHYGVREHVMGSMLNGMASHGGVVPVGVTYLVFSDYNRAPMRMAALMGLPVKFVFSHDSIGIGTQRADPPAGRVSWPRSGRCPTCWCCARPMRSRRPSAGRSR